MNRYINTKPDKGFTIIELLIVIVIIAILVAITAVGYNGITKSAKDASLKADLKIAQTALELNKAKLGVYPLSLESSQPPISQPKSNTLTYTQLNSGQSYSLSAKVNSDPTQAIAFSPGGVYLQNITKALCPTERTMAVDGRDNRTYWIQQMPDNQCWMLTNLAYGGGGDSRYGDVIPSGDGSNGTISNGTLDPSMTYVLAKYYVSQYANPSTYPQEPSVATDGGVSIETRQFGYHYNWCAAMASQGGSACSNTTTPQPDVSINICPAGWRLPTGDPTVGEFAQLTQALNNTDSDISFKLKVGMFQYGGYANPVPTYMGGVGYYWSSTMFSGTVVHDLRMQGSTFKPSNAGDRKEYGESIRCIAV